MLTAPLPALAPVASPAEADVLYALLAEGEAPVSDAPTFCAVAGSILIILLGPKEPKAQQH
ncbi:hypothetical protein [Streptomyces sp. NPDC031705]|uniref:hypothetical protein n=1 Tax=Streptomyces sp. NPDC031705 TaxID=3155729 RepID=UPI003400156E